MSIKPLDDIPKSRVGRTASYRTHIRADIHEALDKGITKFEFVGDYNYKWLYQYAKEEAQRITLAALRTEWYERYPNKHIESPLLWHESDDTPYIVISSIKDDKQGRRVFCEIYPDAVEKKVKAHKELLDRQEREREKNGSAFGIGRK